MRVGVIGKGSSNIFWLGEKNKCKECTFNHAMPGVGANWQLPYLKVGETGDFWQDNDTEEIYNIRISARKAREYSVIVDIDGVLYVINKLCLMNLNNNSVIDIRNVLCIDKIYHTDCNKDRCEVRRGAQQCKTCRKLEFKIGGLCSIKDSENKYKIYIGIDQEGSWFYEVELNRKSQDNT